MFDIVEDKDALAHGEVPICPPPDDEDRNDNNGYTPTSAASTPESVFLMKSSESFFRFQGVWPRKLGKSRAFSLSSVVRKLHPCARLLRV